MGFAERVFVVPSRGSRNVDTNQISFVLGSRRRFTRQLFGRFEFRYRYQYRSRSNSRNTTTNFVLLSASFEYGLAPIYF